ncbi:Os02g0499350 [Oryza sativa Japonica Group]|jgi:hypothetical protein|uniref:Os02g0499350 protein n=2 Tax=Oryza sativa subsp. japonica TaxID=39947 RepID=B9F048_ORYSJ|nr:hypothetical protein OsJ_06824 [Oryza sativa Japonica Group]BAS78793.1 Os02g0499350 [Oryza sativa Japonica Group]
MLGFVAAALLIAGLDLGQIQEEGDGREEGEDPERILHQEAHRRPCLAIADVAPIHSSVSALPPHNPFRDRHLQRFPSDLAATTVTAATSSNQQQQPSPP